MKTEAKNYKVVIFEEEYHLVSDEPEEHILQAAALVDKMIKELASQAPRSEKHKLAVLTAMQCASKMIKFQQELEKRKKQERELVTRTQHALSSL